MKNRLDTALPVPASIEEQREGDEASQMDALKEQLDSAKEQLTEYAGKLEEMIIARPGASLAVAAVAGVVLGWMIKRK